MTTAVHELRPSMTADVRDALRSAAEQRAAVRVVGSGTWLDAARPLSSAAMTLSVAGLRGIIEHVPGDLTLTCRAGTTLAEIASTARAERQWLALDPFGSPTGTIGATIATASSGPHAHAFGGPRDNVLGVEFVDGTGAVVRGGGRVVKNVAGFDLTRLVTGSWGTLGVVTEVSVRLRAIPESECTLAIALPDGAALASALERFRTVPALPWAAELLDPPLASLVGAGQGNVLLVHLGGNEDSVRGQRTALTVVGDVSELSSTVWERLRGCERPGSATIRFARLPTDFVAAWEDARRVAGHLPGSLVHASPGRGVARCILLSTDAAAVSHALSLVPPTSARAYERLPAQLWPRFARTVIGDPISSRIKRTFDPANILNPGLLGEVGP